MQAPAAFSLCDNEGVGAAMNHLACDKDGVVFLAELEHLSSGILKDFGGSEQLLAEVAKQLKQSEEAAEGDPFKVSPHYLSKWGRATAKICDKAIKRCDEDFMYIDF